MPRRLALAALLAGLPATAGATTQAQVALAASSGFTDNALAAPLGSTGAASPQSDLYITVSPGLILSTEIARFSQRTSLGVSLSRYGSLSQANSVRVNGALTLGYALERNVYSTLSVDVAYLDTPSIVPDSIVEITPTGGARYLSLALHASVTKDFSPQLRGVDDFSVSTTWPVGSENATLTRNVSLEDSVAAQYSFQRDAVEGRLTGRLHLGEGAPLRVRPGMTVTAAWLHELDPFWSLLVGGGVGFEDVGDGVRIAPLARARVNRQGEWATVYLELAQTLQTSTLLNQTFMTSSATLGASARFARDHQLGFDVGAGGSHAREPSTTSGTRIINSAHLSTAVAWTVNEYLNLDLRHDLVYQVADAVMGSADLSLLRNTVVLGVSARWPKIEHRREVQPILFQVRETEERERERQGGAR